MEGTSAVAVSAADAVGRRFLQLSIVFSRHGVPSLTISCLYSNIKAEFKVKVFLIFRFTGTGKKLWMEEKKYTIKDAADMMHVPTSTIRYYDKEGLLPFVERLESGYRIFTEKDLATLRIIDCLKKTGMSIREIRQFSQWLEQGDASLQQRYEMFLERKRAVEAQMKELQGILDIINMKCRYYEEAIAAGTEKIHFKERVI